MKDGAYHSSSNISFSFFHQRRDLSPPLPISDSSIATYIHSNTYVHILCLYKSQVGRSFLLKERRTKLSIEIRSGIITFLMVAYILALNPQILSVTGGSCNAQELCDENVSTLCVYMIYINNIKLLKSCLTNILSLI